jgi:quercetin dioxygenase-like cupin family protein
MKETMEILDRPQLKILVAGTVNTVLEIVGVAGTQMPPHYCTGEAIIVLQRGEAILRMSDGEHFLKSGSSFVIPAGKEHSLIIKKDIKALAVMEINSEINFI